MSTIQTQAPPAGEPFRWPPFCRHPELPAQPQKPDGRTAGGKPPVRRPC